MKILFIAVAHSSHTVSWVEMFKDTGFEILVYGVDRTEYPGCYLSIGYSHYLKTREARKLFNLIMKINRNTLNLKCIEHLNEEDYLSKMIIKYSPDIIHTLGFENAGFILNKVYHLCKKKVDFTWIHTIRGSELSLKGYLPEKEKVDILNNVDFVIADNYLHYQIVKNMNIKKNSFADSIFPGSGGLKLPSDKKAFVKKEKIVLWPKAYDCIFSKSLPVLEAIKIAWEKISPCKFIFTAVDSQTELWIHNLPDDIRRSISIFNRIDRSALLEIMKKAKVLLIPSLSDGIPNSFYEGSMNNMIIILSPLPTFDGVIGVENALFAKNLYPEELANKLVEALDDSFDYSQMFKSNWNILRENADIDKNTQKMISIYKKILLEKKC